MSRIVWTYGVICGAIIISSVILGLFLSGEDSTMKTAEWLGYLVMIVALSMIFVGIKRYRDRELGGIIRFGTAFKLGLGISLVASAIYVVSWEVNLALTDHAFIDVYTESVVAARQAEGVEGAALSDLQAEMEQMKENYGKLRYRLPMTFIEIFPVGLLITLLSAAVLRNSNVLPARA